MSVVAIRAALEKDLEQMSPALPTAFENEDFTRPEDGAFQIVHVLSSGPANNENSSSYTELGTLFVRLMYPPGEGWGAAAARAQAIRDRYPRGRSIVATGGLVITIEGTPMFGTADIDDGRFSLPVQVPFYAHISA